MCLIYVDDRKWKCMIYIGDWVGIKIYTNEMMGLLDEKGLEAVAMTISVRELPPPTPREAYLPQRPERVHSGRRQGQVDSAPSWLKSSQDKAESREERDQETSLRRKQE